MWDPLLQLRSGFSSNIPYSLPPTGRILSPTPVKPLSIPASLLLTALLLALAPASHAAETDPCTATSTTSEVQFSLALPPTQSTFRQGELIPLTLTFSSTVKGRYSIRDTFDFRGDVRTLEDYCIEPHAPDPLASFFGNPSRSVGGILWIEHLETTPNVTHAALNEYRSLGPGHYRLYVVSNRVLHAHDAGGESSAQNTSEIIRSNTVDLVIIPASPEWQAQQLQASLAGLSSPAVPHISYIEQPARKAALQIRFLNTPESTRELARLHAEDAANEFQKMDFELGLFTSPYRQIAIESLRRQIALPSIAVSGAVLRTLVDLQRYSDSTHDATPDESPSHPTPSHLRKVTPASRGPFWEPSQLSEQELYKIASLEALAALPHKTTGPARAITALTLIPYSLYVPPTDPATVAELRKILIASWDDLPEITRLNLLQHGWRSVDGPDMLPILLKIASEPPPHSRLMEGKTREAALRHLAELDLPAAIPFLQKEVTSPYADFSFGSLKLLPPGDIAAAIPPAIKKLAHNQARDMDYLLIDHFADTSYLPAIQAAFEQRGHASVCGIEVSFLRYFLRVAPDYGAAQVTAALRVRDDKHSCYRTLLGALGDQLPAAESSAIAALNDPDPDLQQDAVSALSWKGTAAAEAPLYARLERFHEEWSARSSSLCPNCESKSPGRRAFDLDLALVNGLASGSGWLATPEKLNRLKSLALTAVDRQQLDDCLASLNHQPFLITPQLDFDQELTFAMLFSTLTEDPLRTRLSQLRAGTRLVWQFFPPRQINPPFPMDQQDAAYNRIRTIATQHGLTLEKQDHP